MADGADLASVHTREENEFIASLKPNSVTAWIGAAMVRTSSPVRSLPYA
jgi:hypothetical protein